ncbi:MAG: winged helix-turn-helix domain-containing protein [Candidatus Polarisedimenticolia bacterium]|nr:winged helix-turn-helix domain-containing protein [bacterium]
MSIREPRPADTIGTSRVREHLMTDLHVARLQPGQRVPSVRRMAQLTGLDRKTVHRAYVRLAAEGLLVARPGSGTYLAPTPRGAAAAAAPEAPRLLAAVERALDDAKALGLDPAAFARFLQRMAERRLHHVRIGVLGENWEQLGLVARDVEAALGAIVRPMLIESLTGPEHPPVASFHGLVATDDTVQEARKIIGADGPPVYGVAVDPALANAAVRQARLGPVLFVVRDLRFEPYIKRMLARLEVPANIIERIRFCDPTGIDRAVSQIRGAGALFVSRLVETEVGRRIPSGWRRLPPAPFIDAASLELLRARVTLADVEREGPLAGLAGAAAAKGAERRPEAQH